MIGVIGFGDATIFGRSPEDDVMYSKSRKCHCVSIGISNKRRRQRPGSVVEPPEDSGPCTRKLRMKQDEGGDKRGREPVGGSLRTRSLREQINTGAAPAHEHVSSSLFLSPSLFSSPRSTLSFSLSTLFAYFCILSLFSSHELANARLYFNSR